MNMENKYEVVDVPINDVLWGKWTAIFKDLPYNKAIKLEYDTTKEASKRGTNIASTFRQRRAKVFRVRYRVIKDGDKAVLYLWKEALNGKR